jgi:hypothetical protein
MARYPRSRNQSHNFGEFARLKDGCLPVGFGRSPQDPTRSANQERGHEVQPKDLTMPDITANVDGVNTTEPSLSLSVTTPSSQQNDMLNAAAEKIRTALLLINVHRDNLNSFRIQIGHELIAAKARLDKHGAWIAWLKKEFSWKSERTSRARRH